MNECMPSVYSEKKEKENVNKSWISQSLNYTLNCSSVGGDPILLFFLSLNNNPRGLQNALSLPIFSLSRALYSSRLLSRVVFPCFIEERPPWERIQASISPR